VSDTGERGVPVASTLPYGRSGLSRKRAISLVTIAAGFVCIVLMMEVLLPLLNHPHDHSPRIKCASNMRQIGLGAIMYAASNGGRFPDDLDTLMDSQDLSPVVLMCPDSTGDVPAEPTTREVVSTMRKSNLISYTYAGKGLTTQASAHTVLLYERLGSHGDGMNVLFADGHVEYLDANEAQTVLKQAASGSSPILYPMPTSQPTTLPATRQ